MPAPKKPWSEDKRKQIGQQSLQQSWGIKRSGRPPKKTNIVEESIITTRRTHPSKEKKRKGPPTAPAKRKDPPRTAPTVPMTKKQKATRGNYSKGELLNKLTAATSEWLNKTGRYFDPNGEAMPMNIFAKVVGIPMSTFKHYVNSDLSKRRQLGVAVGTKSLVEPRIQRAVVDSIARYDRGNNGRTQAEAIDMLNELHPELSRKQASNCLKRTILATDDARKKIKQKSQKQRS